MNRNEKNSQRVMYLITSLDYGGAEVQVMNLATKIKKANAVSIVSLIPPNDNFLKKYNQSNISIASLNMARGKISIKSLHKAIKHIQHFKPSILHCHMVHANILGRVVKILYPHLKLISTAHNINEGGQVLMSLYKITNHLSSLNTNVSKRATNRYLHEKIFPMYKTLFIPNGHEENILIDKLEIKKEFSLDQSTFIWLAVGRFEIQKDYPNMILACKHVLSHYHQKQFCVLIAGEGNLKDPIAIMVKQEGLEDSIKILGNRTDIPRLMMGADAFILSSEWEGLPMVLIEACSARLPIVSTRVGGVDEIVSDGINGFTCAPGDYVSLGERMVKMMISPQKKIDEFKKASYEIYKRHYMLKKIVDKWEHIYQSL
jgi:glycosyltransferase involved in cell wall biosynthesis